MHEVCGSRGDHSALNGKTELAGQLLAQSASFSPGNGQGKWSSFLSTTLL